MLMVVDRLDIMLFIVGMVKRVMSLVISVIGNVMVTVLMVTHNWRFILDDCCLVQNGLLMMDSLDSVTLLHLVMLRNDVANSFMVDWLVSHGLMSVGNLVLVDILMDLSVVSNDLLLIVTLTVESCLVDSMLMVVNRLYIALVVVVMIEGMVGLVILMHNSLIVMQDSLVVMHDSLVVMHDSLVVMNLLVARDQAFMAGQLWHRVNHMLWSVVQRSWVVQDWCLVGLYYVFPITVILDLQLLVQVQFCLVNVLLLVHMRNGIVVPGRLVSRSFHKLVVQWCV